MFIRNIFMAEGEDDYLSDKFLIESAPSGSKSQGNSYSERRRQAQRKSELKNVQNRKKSRRQLEEEAREEGLKKSLFERAKEEEQELGTQSKAMSLMMKMGFKPGQTLGASDSMAESHLGRSSERIAVSPTVAESTNEMTDGSDLKDSNKLQHRKEPLPIELRSGERPLPLCNILDSLVPSCDISIIERGKLINLSRRQARTWVGQTCLVSRRR